jgi:hypothetical protein
MFSHSIILQGYHVRTSTMWLLWTMVNIFAYYAKSNATKNYIFYFMWYDIKMYLHKIKCMLQNMKNRKIQ